jgi:mannose-1-phosphate guanylyltransferase/phosphomannomutase
VQPESERAVVQPGVKIWPGKEVEAGATVTRSIIWGSQGRRVLFGRYGVTGVVNVDLTPDFAARLGAAFGSVLPKGNTVTINRDPHRSPRMIKRAIISGLPSAGNNVLDLRMVPIPAARYYTRAVKASGGVHVRLSPYDQRVVDIRFFGPDGLNLTREQERAVERIFFREDYRRTYMEDIGTIDTVPDAVIVYDAGYMNAVDAQAIRESAFKVVVDYAHAPAAEVLPQLLEQLNVEVVPLNARIDANKISLSQDEFRAGLSQLARITGALHGISLGVRLDVGGEKIFVVDDAGSNIPDDVLAAAMAALVFRSHPGSTIVVSTDQSCAFEELAKLYGGSVRRCAVDPQALMRAAANGDVVMACDGTGSFVFPALHPAVDGLLAVGKLLELLAVQKTRLSEVVAGLPVFFTASARVEGDPETKGRVMRCLVQQFSKFRHEAMDGIKVYLDDCEWVLIRPDEDAAVFHLVAEARSQVAAQELIADYSGLVQDLIREPCAPVGAAANLEGGVLPGA